jgi:uncharacterized protein with HEPN domain
MGIEIKTWLSEIMQAIDEINQFIPDKKDFTAFRKDLKSKRAVERNIEIIGEAVSRILKTNPDFQISNARKIVDTRNRIIHGYDNVSEEIIWAIVVRDLVKLESEINKILNTL